ncbi:DNA modification methylase [Adhaeribacter swui]|uniref:site-specific DNA-methyltransferase (adenine-specific) n=1 Tax=Adhaeribacter swui TaxID=2086471 RepID=A0A7G7GB22_9BACT|nr:DNA modification methylase [Adhaeribacter swui]QNF34356.1 DNA modification methylase [Adhaeribacter swui]
MTDLQWETVKRQVKDLVPYEYNPRILTPERIQKLKESFEKFSLVEIPAINLDNILIAGHQRIKVMVDLGWSEQYIDVRCPNRMLTEKEMKEYNITSNVPVGFWDRDILEEVFSDIDLADLGLDLSEIKLPDSLLKELHPEEEQDFEPILPREPISVLGDLYEFQSIEKKLVHRVHCASSTDSDAVAKLLAGKMVNLLITDPPYNVDYQGGTKEKLKIENDKMDNDSFYQFLYDFYCNCFLFLEPGAPFYIFHADSEGANFRQALKDAQLKLAQCLIWVKNSIVMGRQDYHWQHEPILYGWKEGAAHKWYSDRKQSTVLEFDRPTRNAEHPTMKPIPILTYLLEQSSQRRDIVADFFGGSGSTLIACEQLQRQCYAQELDPRFVDVHVRRWVKYMRDNNLPFTVKRNGVELDGTELSRFDEAQS